MNFYIWRHALHIQIDLIRGLTPYISFSFQIVYMHVLFQFNDIFDAMMYFVYQLSGILMWRAIPHSLNIIYRYRLTPNLSSNIQDNVMLVDLFHYSTYATNIKQHDVSQFAPDKILLSYYDSFLYSSCIFLGIQFQLEILI